MISGFALELEAHSLSNFRMSPVGSHEMFDPQCPALRGAVLTISFNFYQYRTFRITLAVDVEVNKTRGSLDPTLRVQSQIFLQDPLDASLMDRNLVLVSGRDCDVGEEGSSFDSTYCTLAPSLPLFLHWFGIPECNLGHVAPSFRISSATPRLFRTSSVRGCRPSACPTLRVPGFASKHRNDSSERP